MNDLLPSPAQPNLAQKAYEHIHESILQGRLAVGSVVSEAALAKTLGISRTPVGEAIRQLAREGLVHQVPRYGTIVRQIDRQEVIELYEMREALESFCAAKVASKPAPQIVSRLGQFGQVIGVLCDEVAGLSPDDEVSDAVLRRFLAADLAFHMTILESTGNRRIIETVRTMKTLSRVFRLRRAPHTRRAIVATMDQHTAINDAITAGDSEAARLAMAGHIRASKVESLAFLDVEWKGENRPALAYELPPELVRDIDAIEQTGQPAASRSTPGRPGLLAATGN
jgi:DNA-binding GntR family transcriptional regulator